MSSAHSTVISMRLPVASGNRLKRMANRYGWTPSDASARLVEEGLRRSEFAFIDFPRFSRRSASMHPGQQSCCLGDHLTGPKLAARPDGYCEAFALAGSEGAGSRQLRRGVS
jgi:hypothetical protein